MRKILFFCFIFYSATSIATTYYDILNVPRDASQKEIKRAYTKMIREFHPDRNPDPDATQISQKINKAYDILKNPILRTKYDQELEAQEYQTSTEPNNEETGPTDKGNRFHEAIEKLDLTSPFDNSDTRFRTLKEMEPGIRKTVFTIFKIWPETDINAVNGRKETPLALAIKQQFLKVAYLFLETGAKPEIQDEDDNNALHLLAMEQHTWYDLELEYPDSASKLLNIKFYSQRKKDRDNRRKDLLLLAKTAIEKAKGSNLLTARNNEGDRPLHTAIQHGFSSLAELLIEALEQEENVDWNTQDNSGQTYLSLAIKTNSPVIAQKLLKNGAKPEIQDENGNNALHLLAMIWDAGDPELHVAYRTDKSIPGILRIIKGIQHSYSYANARIDTAASILAFARDLIKAAKGTNLLTARNNAGKLPIQFMLDIGARFSKELAELIIEQGGAETLTKEELDSLIQQTFQNDRNTRGSDWVRTRQLLTEESMREGNNSKRPPYNLLNDQCQASFTSNEETAVK